MRKKKNRSPKIPCAKIKSDGVQCRQFAMKNSQFCWTHEPKNKDAIRIRNMAGGALSRKHAKPVVRISDLNGKVTTFPMPRTMASVEDVSQLLHATTARVLDGSIDPKTGAVVGGLSSVALKCMESKKAPQGIAKLKVRFDRGEEVERTIEVEAPVEKGKEKVGK